MSPGRCPRCVIIFKNTFARDGINGTADPRLAPALFYSPVLFVDGHTAIHNFSKSLATDPYYPFEETRNWVWYTDQAFKVVRDAAGDIIVTGFTEDGTTGQDMLTIKYSGADGSVL